jgi:hypothetical protein
MSSGGLHYKYAVASWNQCLPEYKEKSRKSVSRWPDSGPSRHILISSQQSRKQTKLKSQTLH